MTTLSLSTRLRRAASTWGAIITLLMVQHYNQRFKSSRIGIILTFIEPVLLVVSLVVFRTFIKLKLPEFGTSMVVFLSSGIFPYYFFLRVSTRMNTARFEAGRRLPRVGSTDIIIASAGAETVLMFSTMIIWFASMWLYGLEEACPASSFDCVVPLLLFVAMGVGVALINSTIAKRFPPWSFLYGRVTYGMMFLSGVFYVVDLLPVQVRSIMLWNPLVHGVEWFRTGLYGRYPAFTLDKQYLIVTACMTLLVGLVAHRGTMRVERV